MAQQFPDIPNPDIDPIDLPPPVDVQAPEPEQPFVAETTVAVGAGADDGSGPLVGTGDSGGSGPSAVGGVEIGLLALAAAAVSAAVWLTRKRLAL